MKKVLAVLAIAGSLVACGNNEGEGTETTDTTTTTVDTVTTAPVTVDTTTTTVDTAAATGTDTTSAQ